MGYARVNSFSMLAGLAVMSAMEGGIVPPKRRQCTYFEPCGPQHPTTRQQRRALERKSAAALAKLG